MEDHKEAKQVMKTYLEDVIESADDRASQEVKEAKEILESPLFIEQKGIRSITDKDARVGYKSKTDTFFGYKMEYVLTTDGHLITAVDVHDGAYVDGTDFNELYKRSKQSGLNINAVYGDKAYFKKNILEILKADETKAYIPVSASCYRIDEEQYSYNKDSDQWVCVRGNRTLSRKTQKRKRKNGQCADYYKYIFDKDECVGCSLRDECIGNAAIKAKILTVGTSAGDYYEHSQWTKTEEFQDEYRKRASIEWKNAELKRFHGLARATSYGVRSVSTQAKLTALAVNLKRIAALVSSLKTDFSPLFMKLRVNFIFFNIFANTKMIYC